MSSEILVTQDEFNELEKQMLELDRFVDNIYEVLENLISALTEEDCISEEGKGYVDAAYKILYGVK